jgi:hypothetical protein
MLFFFLAGSDCYRIDAEYLTVTINFWNSTMQRKWHTFPARVSHRIRIGLCRPSPINCRYLFPLDTTTSQAALLHHCTIHPAAERALPTLIFVKRQPLFLDCDTARNVSQFPVQMYKTREN